MDSDLFHQKHHPVSVSEFKSGSILTMMILKLYTSLNKHLKPCLLRSESTMLIKELSLLT